MKISAAVDARSSSDLPIMARTDAVATHGIDEAIERANCFVAAGADISFVEAPDGGGHRPRRTPVDGEAHQPCRRRQDAVAQPRAELAQHGCALVLYANAGLQAAILAMQEVYGHLYEHGDIDAISHRLAGFEERQRVIRKDLYDELDAKYATGENK